MLNLRWLNAEPRATLYGGSLRYTTSLIFTLGFLALFTIGGLTTPVSSLEKLLFAGKLKQIKIL